MIEMTTHPSVQRAFQKAHCERGKAVRSILRMIFGSR